MSSTYVKVANIPADLEPALNIKSVIPITKFSNGDPAQRAQLEKTAQDAHAKYELEPEFYHSQCMKSLEEAMKGTL